MVNSGTQWIVTAIINCVTFQYFTVEHGIGIDVKRKNGLSDTEALPQKISQPHSPESMRPGHPVWERPVTPQQLARFLQVSPRTVLRLAKRRDFPKIAIEGRVRFIPNEVVAHLQKKPKP
jgi:hypothetical protein